MYQQKHSDMVKSMVHGKPSMRRQKSSQPCIYDIFNWQAPKQLQIDKNIKNLNSKPNHSYQPHQQQDKRYNQLQYCDSCPKCRGHSRFQNDLDPEKYEMNEYMIGKPKNNLKPHVVKKQLYMYEDFHLKKDSSQDYNNDTNLSKNKTEFSRTKAKLNQNDQKDRATIQKRKQKIKQFNKFTRDLPNSAFTTYYGRPAFESYGRCNSGSHLKTHNVMPHRGENHPRVKQTYQSALLKGKNVKMQDHLPRKPVQSKIIEQNDKKKDKIIHLPLEKPDLINHIRFSQSHVKSDRKQPTPSFQKLNKQIKIKKKQQQRKNKKKKQKQQKSLEQEDGLKYMNTRDHLINLIQAKKKKDSKLAYKVTQCYPQVNSIKQNTEKTESDAQQLQKVAGIKYQKSEPAERVIYRRYV